MTITLNDLHDVETRVTDEGTGGQKGVKITQPGALDPVALIELSRVAGMGAAKYTTFNYLKGYDWSLSFNAMQRHALLFWAGEDRDEESQLLHMAHAAWHCLTLISFAQRGLGTDDRPPQLTVTRTVDRAILEEMARSRVQLRVSQTTALYSRPKNASPPRDGCP